MKKNYLIFILVLVFFSGCRTVNGFKSDIKSGRVLELDSSIERGVLPNGFVYFIKTNKNPEKRASLRLFVNAGSVLEEEDQRGIAHLVEHMAFNGTKNFKKNELINYLESIGIAYGPEVNAYTGFDSTVYKLDIPTDDPGIIENSFQVIEDWAHQLTLDDEEIDRERGVIREEWRLGRGASSRKIDKLLPLLFEGSRYAVRMPIGDMDVVMNTPSKRVRAFYKKWYRPDLMAVVVVGDFDKTEIKRLIKKHFSYTHEGEIARRPLIDVPINSKTGVSIFTDPELTSAQVSIRYKEKDPPLVTESDYYGLLKEYLFWGMFNDRLDEESRKENSPFLEAYGGRSDIVRNSSLVTLTAMADPEKVLESMERILYEKKRIAVFGFSETELRRKKADIMRYIEKAYIERENRKSADIASEIGAYYLKNEAMPGIEFEYDFFRKNLPLITLEEVNSLSGELFDSRDCIITASVPVLPKGLTENKILSLYKDSNNLEVKNYVDDVRDQPLISTLPRRGKIVKVDSIAGIDTEIWTLSNGVRVVLKKTDFKEDQILFSAASPGGSSLVNEQEYIPALTALRIIKESGLGDFNAVQLEKLLSGKDVSVSSYINTYFEGLSGESSRKDLETLMQLIYLNFTSPRFEKSSFMAVKNRLETKAKNRAGDPEALFYDTIITTLMQNHYRSRPLTPELVEEMDIKKSEKVYKERFLDAGDFTFVFVGNIDKKYFKAMVETYLASLPATGREEKGKDTGVRFPDGKKYIEVKKGIEPKSLVAIIFSGETKFSREKSIRISATAKILETKLRELLREKLSGTYFVNVDGVLRRRPVNSFRISILFGCDPGRVEELTSAVFDEIKNIKDMDVEESYLNKIKENYKREFEVALRDNNFWLSKILNSLKENENPADLMLPEEYRALITKESIRSEAEECFNTERYFQVVLKPGK